MSLAQVPEYTSFGAYFWKYITFQCLEAHGGSSLGVAEPNWFNQSLIIVRFVSSGYQSQVTQSHKSDNQVKILYIEMCLSDKPEAKRHNISKNCIHCIPPLVFYCPQSLSPCCKGTIGHVIPINSDT